MVNERVMNGVRNFSTIEVSVIVIAILVYT